MTVFLSLIYKQGQVTRGHPIRGIFFEKTQGEGVKQVFRGHFANCIPEHHRGDWKS